MGKLVSVIVPCYRHEKYIESCLKSIMAQTYQNIELIVCDDCSPDHSYEIICSMQDELKKRFSRVEIIRNDTNQGVTKNLNKMIRIAKGDYIKDIASDDMLMPNCITDLVDYVENHPCDIAFSNGWEIGEEALYIPSKEECRKKIYESIPKYGTKLTGDICAFNFIYSPSAIYPAQTFKKYGLYDENLMIEDFEYMLRVSVSGKILYLDKETVWYRVSADSLSHFNDSYESIKRMRKINDCRMTIFEMYEKYCNKKQIAQFYNDNVALAMIVNDPKSLVDFKQIMKKKKIKISEKNRIKIILYKLGIYKIIRDIVKKR